MAEINLWKVRTARNLTLKQLEELTGISKSTLNNIENGKVQPNIEQLERIAKALDCKISDIIRSQYL